MSDSLAWLFLNYMPLGLELSAHARAQARQLAFTGKSSVVRLGLGVFPLDEGRSDIYIFAQPSVFSIVALGNGDPQMLVQALVKNGDYEIVGGSMAYLFGEV